MSALDRIEAWIEEAETILRLLDGHDLAESIVATRAAALRDARDLFAPEYEQAEESEEHPAEETAEDPAEDRQEQLPAPAEPSPAPRASRVAPSVRTPDSGQPDQPAEEPRVWTPERDALALRMKAAGAPITEIWQACNALPGPAIASSNSTQVRLSTLKKRAEAQPANPLAGLPDDEIAEARDMLANPSNGARHLAEYFGWALSRAQEIAAALRAEQKAAAA
ncbi:hypothetical protein [Synechococcus phage MinM1]|nr:hypothetical protein [Synechococcus phage MinM1]